MKHIKPYNIFENSQEPQHPGFPETEEEIHKLCKKYNISNYTINDDLSIDVAGDVKLQYKKLTYLPLKFNHVSGNFYCSKNNLTSLEGAPHKVNGSFVCHNNKLTSLEGSPLTVGGYFSCSDNKLKTLKGAPHTIGGSFDCFRNELTSLEGAPKEVGGNFYGQRNKLKSLEGAPKTVGGGFYCTYNNLLSLKSFPNNIDYNSIYTKFNNNPIYTLVITFIKNDNAKDLVREFNDYDIIRGDKVVLDRLKVFINDFDLEMPNMDKVMKYYKIV